MSNTVKIVNKNMMITQAEFIKVFEAPLNFVWWAKTLVTEETKELQEALKKHSKAEPKHKYITFQDVMKETADLQYVLCGMYNTMPMNPKIIVSNEIEKEIYNIFQNAVIQLSIVFDIYEVTLEESEKWFMEVHKSNMSKLDNNGNPIRRDDGKIMKGPNYQPPDMSKFIN